MKQPRHGRGCFVKYTPIVVCHTPCNSGPQAQVT